MPGAKPRSTTWPARSHASMGRSASSGSRPRNFQAGPVGTAGGPMSVSIEPGSTKVRVPSKTRTTPSPEALLKDAVSLLLRLHHPYFHPDLAEERRCITCRAIRRLARHT